MCMHVFLYEKCFVSNIRTNAVKMAEMKILRLLSEFQLFCPAFYLTQSFIYTSCLICQNLH